jgi:hypothetical protein
MWNFLKTPGSASLSVMLTRAMLVWLSLQAVALQLGIESRLLLYPEQTLGSAPR